VPCGAHLGRDATRCRRARAPRRPPRRAAREVRQPAGDAALICSDVEQTISFYQGLLGFPLVELVENRDYPGSTHFFFDLGNETLLGFFDFPGLGLEQAPEGFGNVQHIAISVPPDAHAKLRARLDELEIPYDGPQRGIPESMYLRDPDGVGVELLSDPRMWFGGQWLDGRDAPPPSTD
jgi:glyoxylase I family protein